MDDFDSPFGMMRLFGMLVPAMVMLLVISLWGVIILYVVARWRHHRAGTRDPQLGLKFALHLFRFHGYQLLLMGGLLLLYAFLLKGNSAERSPVWRSALGLFTSGGIVFGLHTVWLAKTNDELAPLVGRLFRGMSLVLTGLIGFIALVAACQLLFAKGSSGDGGRLVWSALLIYGTAWGVQGVVFARAAMTSAEPDAAVPPAPPSPPSPPVPEPMRQPLA
ncbi:MAG: hypothetical protein R3B06_09205 [Kofleriaceae bacterium]